MIDEDEDDNSNVAMALHFGVRLTCQGHTPRIMVASTVLVLALSNLRPQTKQNIQHNAGIENYYSTDRVISDAKKPRIAGIAGNADTVSIPILSTTFVGLRHCR
jgi:hypothetical protein